jgi:hypothetical protein
LSWNQRSSNTSPRGIVGGAAGSECRTQAYILESRRTRLLPWPRQNTARSAAPRPVAVANVCHVSAPAAAIGRRWRSRAVRALVASNSSFSIVCSRRKCLTAWSVCKYWCCGRPYKSGTSTALSTLVVQVLAAIYSSSLRSDKHVTEPFTPAIAKPRQHRYSTLAPCFSRTQSCSHRLVPGHTPPRSRPRRSRSTQPPRRHSEAFAGTPALDAQEVHGSLV